MEPFLTATEARKKFYALINFVGHPGVSVVVTHEGIPKVVVMSFEDFEGWQETMEIIAESDAEMDKDILAGIREMQSAKCPKNTVPLRTLRKKRQR